MIKYPWRILRVFEILRRTNPMYRVNMRVRKKPMAWWYPDNVKIFSLGSAKHSNPDYFVTTSGCTLRGALTTWSVLRPRLVPGYRAPLTTIRARWVASAAEDYQIIAWLISWVSQCQHVGMIYWGFSVIFAWGTCENEKALKVQFIKNHFALVPLNKAFYESFLDVHAHSSPKFFHQRANLVRKLLRRFLTSHNVVHFQGIRTKIFFRQSNTQESL